MSSSDVARFEFRIFAADLASVRDKLNLRAKGTLQDPSRETYIVSRRNAESNVKIRARCLEVKGLQRRLPPPDQSLPLATSPLPLPAASVADDEPVEIPEAPAAEPVAAEKTGHSGDLDIKEIMARLEMAAERAQLRADDDARRDQAVPQDQKQARIA
mgnify:CR=1 FL=1